MWAHLLFTHSKHLNGLGMNKKIVVSINVLSRALNKLQVLSGEAFKKENSTGISKK